VARQPQKNVLHSPSARWFDARPGLSDTSPKNANNSFYDKLLRKMGGGDRREVSELLGNFHRPGATYTEQPVETFDHDFGSAGQGKLIPHGIYDLTKGHAHIHLNTSHDTSELCCDSIASWWEQHGRAAYPRAKRLLILCDGGGSNSATQYLFKEDLQRLANRLNMELRVAHYPPYCSKYNPIEHRVFPHITRACQGVIFHTLDVARQFIERAKTSMGLRVTVSVLEKVYSTGRKYAEGFKETMKIVFDEHLPKWNYRAIPES
jgi:hypothetical protein